LFLLVVLGLDTGLNPTRITNKSSSLYVIIFMSKKSGYESAVRAAVEKLGKIELTERCTRLGLPEPGDGIIKLRAFGTDMVLRLSDYQLILGDSGQPAKISDRILVLHYLLCDLPITRTDELISFRHMDSGQFYLPAFLSLSVRPLAERIGNDLALLKKNLDRFDWEPVSLGDLGARIHAVGKVFVTLVYRLGDDEFPASADILFDAGIKRVFPTEDAAVLAGRICLGLI
jgi:hypothetical protein